MPFRRRGKFSWIQIIAVILVSACTSLGAYWNILLYVRKMFLRLTLEEFCHYSIWSLDRIKACKWASERKVLKSYRLRSLLALLPNKAGCLLPLLAWRWQTQGPRSGELVRGPCPGAGAVQVGSARGPCRLMPWGWGNSTTEQNYFCSSCFPRVFCTF